MSLFKFPVMLSLMLLCAVAIGVFWYLGIIRKNLALKKLFSAEVMAKINVNYSAFTSRLRDVLFLLGLFLMFISLAGPQWGLEEVNIQTEMSYTVIAVDVSSSMKARDLKPNRIENAKTMLKILLETMAGSRVGIVAFTSKAYVQTPITNDDDALQYFVNNLRPDMLRAKGTSLFAAVETSVGLLGKYPGKKALVILTDGEDHTPDELRDAVRLAKLSNVKIIAVGIGTPEGELIPEDIVDGQVTGYKKDKDGNTVVSKLDEKGLQTLASSTGGAYIKYTNFQSVAQQIGKSLEDLDKETRDSRVNQGYKNRYQIPLAVGIILALLSLIIPTKKVSLL
ncbi:Ca-activated chloride channel family protein [Elusimicrobium simillimum]|uniref:vWA domain-containing protein n=1 Tax=Elusimicrobium simillimum TaxID=3143438 RepID=UPI003C6F2790